MDQLWTPWRFNYISSGGSGARRGVPEALSAWPGEDRNCVFCNLIESVSWGIESGIGIEASERAGLILARLTSCFLCLNAYPYASGHVLIVPYLHLDGLAKLPTGVAEEIMRAAQRVERTLQAVYHPDGMNLGMNVGEAAGAGVAAHVHLHLLPRWFGDTNFMTVIAETRVLPETLETTWAKFRDAFGAFDESKTT